MTFVRQSLLTIVLVLLSLIVQGVGMVALIEWAKAQFPHGIHRLGPLRSILLVVRFTGLLVGLAICETLLWASVYRWNFFPSWEAAFYFSAGQYSTVGSGGLSLPPVWRMMAQIESVTGVLMGGLSAAFLFAVVNRLIELEHPTLVGSAGSECVSADSTRTADAENQKSEAVKA